MIYDISKNNNGVVITSNSTQLIDGIKVPVLTENDIITIYNNKLNGKNVTITQNNGIEVITIARVELNDNDIIISYIYDNITIIKYTLFSTTNIVDVEVVTLTKKYIHNIQIDHTTSSGRWYYQFQFTTTDDTPFTRLNQVGNYLYTNYRNIRLPASGVYIEGNNKYFIESILPLANWMVNVEMYKLSDGSLREISTGSVDVTDVVM